MRCRRNVGEIQATYRRDEMQGDAGKMQARYREMQERYRRDAGTSSFNQQDASHNLPNEHRYPGYRSRCPVFFNSFWVVCFINDVDNAGSFYFVLIGAGTGKLCLYYNEVHCTAPK